MKIHRNLGITQKTVRSPAHKTRKSFVDGNQNFSGVVETDESYFGEPERNKHLGKKLKPVHVEVGKKTVVFLKNWKTNRVAAEVIEYTKFKTLHGFIINNVEKGLTAYSDDFKSYQDIHVYNHRFVNYSFCEYMEENIHTNRIVGFYAVLKRAHNGNFHKIIHKHFDRYVTKFCGATTIICLILSIRLKPLQ